MAKYAVRNRSFAPDAYIRHGSDGGCASKGLLSGDIVYFDTYEVAEKARAGAFLPSTVLEREVVRVRWQVRCAHDVQDFDDRESALTHKNWCNRTVSCTEGHTLVRLVCVYPAAKTRKVVTS